MAITPVDPRPLDILDGGFYVNDPYSRYAWLRENSPCHWDGINELWVLTRYDDIVAVETDKQLFVSSDREKGGYRPNLPADQSIIGTDDPLHQARRSLVSRRFTPGPCSGGAATSPPPSTGCSTRLSSGAPPRS